MPAKTGGSHASAALVTMLLGSVLSNYAQASVPPLGTASATIGQLLTTVTGMPFSRRLAGAVVLMVGLSFLWGTAYHLARHS